MLQDPRNLFDKVKSSFVLALLSKWYLAIAIPAMSITYIVFKKLDELGIFDMILAEIEKNLGTIHFIAENCTSKILKISEFLKCIDF